MSLEGKTTGGTGQDSGHLWSQILSHIKEKVTQREYETWFEPIQLSDLHEDRILLSVPNLFFKEWFQNRYGTILTEAFQKILGQPSHCTLIVDQDLQTPVRNSSRRVRNEVPPTSRKSTPMESAIPSKTSSSLTPSSESSLNPRFIFENFVVGRNNRLAHAAAFSVADSDRATYNPLFIHGESGLGKTHLLHAIGHHAQKARGRQRIFYVPCEEFTNQLILAIQTRKTNEFRSKYRKADILLLDDVHFFSGKESSMEEFFHTFNSLHSAHKQIILSSDRPPTEIPVMEERLISRFEWGLVADIQPPDLETRVAILQRRSEQLYFTPPEDVISLIAENISTNIRKLEGALTRVVAYASLNGGQMSYELAKEILRDTLPREEPKTPITPELIQRAVAECFDLRIADLKTRRRHRMFSYPRHMAMYLMRDLTRLSLPEIGELFGGRDHSSVLYALNKTSRLAEEDDQFRKDLARVRSFLNSIQETSPSGQ